MKIKKENKERPKKINIPLSMKVGGWLLLSLIIAMGSEDRS